jgi:hypothetical protein
MWWKLQFKVFFIRKCIKLYIFYFFKIIFDIRTLKNIKKLILIKNKEIFLNF